MYQSLSTSKTISLTPTTDTYSGMGYYYTAGTYTIKENYQSVLVYLCGTRDSSSAPDTPYIRIESSSSASILDSQVELRAGSNGSSSMAFAFYLINNLSAGDTITVHTPWANCNVIRFFRIDQHCLPVFWVLHTLMYITGGRVMRTPVLRQMLLQENIFVSQHRHLEADPRYIIHPVHMSVIL